jgi:hypothetical protein
MDATEVSPTARRAVENVGGRFHCTERARNEKIKKGTTASALKCLFLQGFKWGVTESNRRPAD